MPLTGEAPLVLVHLGDRPPRYLGAALRLAIRHACVPVVLLAPSTFGRVVPPGCTHVALDSFYDPQRSSALLEQLDPPSGAPQLWVSAVERFAVVQAYIEHTGIRRFFHAEGDTLTFDLPLLGAALDATGHSGAFVPFDDPDRVIASLVYVNAPMVLDEFLAWAPRQGTYMSDMDLWARFGRARPDLVVGLPTVEVMQDAARFVEAGLTVLEPRRFGFLVDAASIGQWVGGVDSLALGLRLVQRNHFLNEHLPDPSHLRSSSVVWDGRRPVFVDPDRRPLRLHSVHLHSKVHRAVARRSGMERLLSRAQLPGDSLVPGAAVRVLRVGCRRIARAVLRRARVAVPRWVGVRDSGGG